MSIESNVIFLGFPISEPVLFQLAGVFGGFLPFVVDLIQRQQQLAQERAIQDKGYYLLKLFILPLCALIVTGFAVSSGNVTTWLAALYLGGSFPILAQKAINVKQPVEKTEAGA